MQMETPRARGPLVAIVILPKVCVEAGPKKDFFIDPRPAPRLQIGQLWDPSMLVDSTFASHLDPSHQGKT
jgi:hypothetical protein